MARYGVADGNGRRPAGLYARRSVVRLTRAVAGKTPAAEFGPVALQEVREQMAARGWGRQYVNDSVSVIIRAFRAAVSRERVATSVRPVVRRTRCRGRAGRAPVWVHPSPPGYRGT